MRTLLRVTFDTQASNNALSDGTFQDTMKSTMENLKPEAAYFLSTDGHRSCFMVFDLKDPSDIPFVAEPFFTAMNAKVELFPVMNAEELQIGLQRLRKPEFALEQ